jgi:hypothetical protein
MDHIRSFFEDLGLFVDGEENNTDSHKSSIDTKSIDVEDNIAVTMPEWDAPIAIQQDRLSLSPSTHSGRGFLQRTRSQRSNKSTITNSASTIPMRKVNNSMLEDEDDYDVVDVEEKKRNTLTGGSGDISMNKGKARSFTRFRFHSRSNDASNGRLTGLMIMPSSNKKNMTCSHINDEDNGISCKTVVVDDKGLDDTPANLFGYACGVEFCSSMELMNKIQGVQTDDESDSILEDEHQKTSNKPDIEMNSSIKKEKLKNTSWKNSSTTVATQQTTDSSSIVTKTHLRRWGHGKFWTIIALLIASTGCICAIMTRQSIHFVTLQQPLIITEFYEPVRHMGMIRVQICTNATTAAALEQGTTNTTVVESGCKIIRFTREEVDDKLYNISRSLLTLGSYLGIALTIVLSTSIVWESINLRPIAIGFLLAYFFQSFSLMFFDTDLCHVYQCKISYGGYLSIITSLCWIGALIAVVKMDLFKIQSIRVRRREERKAKSEVRRQERKALALRKRQQREKMVIIGNFQSTNTESVDVLDIEAVATTDEEYQTAEVEKDKKVLAL